MPRTLQEILDHADALNRQLQDPKPAGDAAPLRDLGDAVTARAATERRIADTVTTARTAGVSWSAIGAMLGTSGEAARKRYTTHQAAPS